MQFDLHNQPYHDKAIIPTVNLEELRAVEFTVNHGFTGFDYLYMLPHTIHKGKIYHPLEMIGFCLRSEQF